MMEQERIRQMQVRCRQQAEQLRRLSKLANLRESGEIFISGDSLLQAAVVIESLCGANEKALEGIERLDRSETQLIDERDNVLDAIAGMYEAVMGTHQSKMKMKSEVNE